jgi:hypothetical protein
MLNSKHPIIEIFHCIMFSFMIYVIVPEYVIKCINMLYYHIDFRFQIPSRLAQKSHNNASLNPELLTPYVQSRISQFRYTRGKKQTPAPVFLNTEFFCVLQV